MQCIAQQLEIRNAAQPNRLRRVRHAHGVAAVVLHANAVAVARLGGLGGVVGKRQGHPADAILGFEVGEFRIRGPFALERVGVGVV